MSKFKVIAVSNTDDECFNHIHVIGGLTKGGAYSVAYTLNAELSGPQESVYYMVVDNDKELYVFEP
jgi:hypothetical protein